MGLRMRLDDQLEILDPTRDHAVFDALIEPYQTLVGRRGVPPEAAARRVRTRATVTAAMLLHTGQAQAALCGGTGEWWRQIEYLLPIIPKRADVSRIYALSALILQSGVLFMCDTHMNLDPTAEQIAEMTQLAAAAVEGFGTVPKIALLSHSSFGSSKSAPARKMRDALALLRRRAPTLEIDGEMHADAALSDVIRSRALPGSTLSGTANLLILPNLDAANIAFNLLKAAADALPIGPLLLGTSAPAHVLVPSVTARGIVNLSALASIEARRKEGKEVFPF
jgi:malate dehydrogenase (oxaloacetate-decarboxylating)(NADP+)